MRFARLRSVLLAAAGALACAGSLRPPMVAECMAEMESAYPARCVVDLYHERYVPPDCHRNERIAEIEVECPRLCDRALCFTAVRDELCVAGARAGGIIGILEESEQSRYRVEPLVCGYAAPEPARTAAPESPTRGATSRPPEPLPPASAPSIPPASVPRLDAGPGDGGDAS